MNRNANIYVFPWSGRESPHLPIPGMTVMVFRARSTRKVLSAEMLPKSTNSVTYLSGKLRWGMSELEQKSSVSGSRMRIPKEFLAIGIITRRGGWDLITLKGFSPRVGKNRAGFYC